MSEAEEAKRDGAKLQPNSGRGVHKKGDAVLGKFCVDIKEYSKSFSLSKNVWAKICTDAFRSGGRSPALKIVLGENDGRKVRIWCISDADMHEYIELLRERDGD